LHAQTVVRRNVLAQEIDAVNPLADAVPIISGVDIAALELRIVALAVKEPNWRGVVTHVVVMTMVVMPVIVMPVTVMPMMVMPVMLVAMILVVVVAMGAKLEAAFVSTTTAAATTAATAETESAGRRITGCQHRGSDRQDRNKIVFGSLHRSSPLGKFFWEAFKKSGDSRLDTL
jgi:hypothetical protein